MILQIYNTITDVDELIFPVTFSVKIVLKVFYLQASHRTLNMYNNNHISFGITAPHCINCPYPGVKVSINENRKTEADPD